MKRKIFSILFCFAFVFQNIAFPLTSVIAETVKSEFEEIKLVQNNIELTNEGDTYIIEGKGRIYAKISLKNYNEGEKRWIRIYNNDHEYQVSNDLYRGGVFETEVVLEFAKEATEYTIALYDNGDSLGEPLDSKTFKLKIGEYQEMLNSNIYITHLEQGENIFEATEARDIKLNSKENIKFSLKGENLNPDAEYTIKSGNDKEYTFTGAELEQGVSLVHETKLEGGLDIQYDYNHLGYVNWINGFLTENGVINNCFSNDYDGQIESKDAEVTVVYTNYPDNEVLFSEFYEYFVVNSNYVSGEDTISLDIKGSKYEDKNYMIDVQVFLGDDAVWEQDYEAYGPILNEGYKLPLNGLQLEFNTKTVDARFYTMKVTVGDVVNKFDIKYNSIGTDASVSSELFFENGKKNLASFMGGGNGFHSEAQFETSKEAFIKFDSMYIRYLGKDFIDDENYQYTLEYTNRENGHVVLESQTVAAGTIDGKTLNNYGILCRIDNNENYTRLGYRMVIRKGTEVIFSREPIINLMDAPSLANVSLSANNKKLYIATGDYDYIATRNAKIEALITGIGFNDKTEYEFNVSVLQMFENKEDIYTEEVVTFTGKQLNEGKAKYKFKEAIDPDATMCQVSTYCTNLLEMELPIQGYFNVKFVDSADLLPNITAYTLDNMKDVIKGVSKETGASEFVANIEVKDNGKVKVKVYTNDGQEEITGNVGTGMIVRVLNEYDEEVLDIDVVVKGDVSGDGNISITDLVKVQRHIDKKEDLEGVYKIAGSVTDGENIQASDAEKISKDVAGIQEVK